MKAPEWHPLPLLARLVVGVPGLPQRQSRALPKRRIAIGVLLGMALIAIATAFASYLLLGMYRPDAPRFLSGNIAGSVLGDVIFFGILTYPIVMGLAFISLGTGQLRIALFALELHLGLYLLCLSFLMVLTRVEPFEYFIHAVALCLEMRLVIQARNRTLMPWPWLVPCLWIAVFAGIWTGTITWSNRLPSRMLAAAGVAADGEPYCIVTGNRRATKPEHLRALTIFVPNADFGSDFHALLVIGPAERRRYFNWSFNRGAFQPVSDHARDRLALLRTGGLDGTDWCALPPHGDASARPL